MAVLDRAALKLFFETGDKPTQAQFADLIDSLFSLIDPNTIQSATTFDADLITDLTRVIKASAGGSQIDLRAFGNDNESMWSSDNGAALEAWIDLTPAGVDMGFGDFNTQANIKGGLFLSAVAATVTFAGNPIIDVRANRLGLFGVSPVTRPDVTGSRGGNAALASLLTALDSLGVITDSTTA